MKPEPFSKTQREDMFASLKGVTDNQAIWSVDCAYARRLKATFDDLDRQVNHWIANHNHMKLKCQTLLSRPDLPANRVQAYQELCTQITCTEIKMTNMTANHERLAVIGDEVISLFKAMSEKIATDSDTRAEFVSDIVSLWMRLNEAVLRIKRLQSDV